ncbi:MAG: nuclear transport factor 2 family protein [Candidatus Caldarchaeum sp.]
MTCVAFPTGGDELKKENLAQIRKEIERVYATWDAHVKAGRIEALIKMIDPSFYAIDLDGKRTEYREAIKMMKEAFSSLYQPQSKIKVEHLYVHGDEVVAWVIMKASARFKENGKWRKHEFEARFAETLRKVNGSWRFVCSQMLP